MKVYYTTDLTQLISYFHRVHLLLTLTLNKENTCINVIGFSNTYGCHMNILWTTTLGCFHQVAPFYDENSFYTTRRKQLTLYQSVSLGRFKLATICLFKVNNYYTLLKIRGTIRKEILYLRHFSDVRQPWNHSFVAIH